MNGSDAVALPGSEREPLPGTRTIGPVDPTEQIQVTVLLRRREELPDDVLSGARRLSREELRDQHGADPADLAQVVAVLEVGGARVIEQDAGSRRIVASGPSATLAGLFGTQLDEVETTDPESGQRARHRQRTGALSVPGEIAGVVTAVLGLDDRPQARPHLRMIAPAAAKASFTPGQVAELYKFPQGTDGTAQAIGVIELGGGIASSDLSSYFGALGIPTPTVQTLGVDGAANNPGVDTNADGEVALDIEVIGAVAPKATQIVYFTPNTDAGFHDAVAQAVHATPTPVAVSISWGQSEDSWSQQGRDALNQAFADGVALGVTVTAASGDNGSGDNVGDGKPHVDFPAASPYVLGCGGTHLQADPAVGIESETTWDDTPQGGGATGGGVSDVVTPPPSWQASAGVPLNPESKASGRGVPDVAGNAAPETGYQVLVGGTQQVIGGTSAVAPLWAGLVARLSQSLGRSLGLLQPALYAGVTAGLAAAGFNDITEGSNGQYDAGPGWDPCTGLGSPDGTALLGVLQARPPAPGISPPA